VITVTEESAVENQGLDVFGNIMFFGFWIPKSPWSVDMSSSFIGI